MKTKQTTKEQHPPSTLATSSAFMQRRRSGRIHIQATIRALFVTHESLTPGETAELFRYQICTKQALNALSALRSCGFCLKIGGHGASGEWITRETFYRQNDQTHPQPPTATPECKGDNQ